MRRNPPAPFDGRSGGEERKQIPSDRSRNSQTALVTGRHYMGRTWGLAEARPYTGRRMPEKERSFDSLHSLPVSNGAGRMTILVG